MYDAFELRVGIVSIFVEASARRYVGTNAATPEACEYAAMLRSRGELKEKAERNVGWLKRNRIARSSWRAQWRATRTISEAKRRLQGGERPKHWGKYWRAAAEALGVDWKQLKAA